MASSSLSVENCNHCGRSVERPYVFCDHCGAPRMRVGRWRLSLNFALAIGAFALSFSNGAWDRNNILTVLLYWDWPLYTLYALFFMQFCLALASGGTGLKIRMGLWFAVFIGGGLAFFSMLHWEGGGALMWEVVKSAPDAMENNPWVFWGAVGAIMAVVLIPAYLRWGRKYGWINAYRVVLLSVAALALGVWGTLVVAGWAYLAGLSASAQPYLAEFVTFVKTPFERPIQVIAARSALIFLSEIFIFASVRGYALARREPSGEAAPAQSGFLKSLLFLAAIIEQMARYVAATLILLKRDLMQVVRAFVRELLTPTFCMMVAAWLVYSVTRDTRSYVESNRMLLVGQMALEIVALIIAAGVFVGCKTRYRWRRLMGVKAQLVGWLLPNLLIMFTIASLSLALSSRAINDPKNDQIVLPFRIGALTVSVIVIMTFLIAMVLVRKRSLFNKGALAEGGLDLGSSGERADAEPSTDPPPDAALHSATSSVQREEGSLSIPEATAEAPVREEENDPAPPKAGWLDGMRELFSSLGKTRHFQQITRSARDFNERMHGRPKVLEDMQEAKRVRREKAAQLEALEKTKESITEEVYHSLREQYARELSEHEKRCRVLQSDLDRQCAEQMVEKGRWQARAAELDARLTEFRRLLDAGALSRAEFDKESETLNLGLQQAIFYQNHCDRLIEFLEPASSHSGSRAEIGAPPGA